MPMVILPMVILPWILIKPELHPKISETRGMSIGRIWNPLDFILFSFSSSCSFTAVEAFGLKQTGS